MCPFFVKIRCSQNDMVFVSFVICQMFVKIDVREKLIFEKNKKKSVAGSNIRRCDLDGLTARAQAREPEGETLGIQLEV